MILCDRSIRFHSAFLNDPVYFDLERLQPASYDVTLGDEFRILRGAPRGKVWDATVPVDPADPATYELECYQVVKDSEFLLKPHQFVLAHTRETFRIPPDIQATVCGKSSLGRLGLFVENAGFVDPGFRGQLTLELFNCSQRPILLRSGMRIAQVSYQQLDTPAACPYGSAELGSHYQNQEGATPSRGSF